MGVLEICSEELQWEIRKIWMWCGTPTLGTIPVHSGLKVKCKVFELLIVAMRGLLQ
jgi:hypothetical protein